MQVAKREIVFEGNPTALYSGCKVRCVDPSDASAVSPANKPQTAFMALGSGVMLDYQSSHRKTHL